jgi:hypothetical protein
MRNARSFLSPVLGAAVCLVLVTSVAHATVVVPLTLAEQVDRADVIVRATVGARQSAFVPERGAILTWTTLNVTEVLKGQASSTLTLRQMGGSANGMVQRVPGDAELTTGQDVVLFLHREGDTVFLLALAQSCYFVDAAHGTVHRDLSNLTFALLGQNGTQLIEPPADGIVRLDALRSEIRSLLGGAR